MKIRYMILFLLSLSLFVDGCKIDSQKSGDIIYNIKPLLNKSIGSYGPSTLQELTVDLEKSIVNWRGTKLMKTHDHQGTVNIKEGALTIENDLLVGGFIITNMKSIHVTDIPTHEIIPLTDLINHLNSDFNTQSYPTSRFDIIEVEYLSKSKLSLDGILTIKGVARKISIIAYVQLLANNHIGFETNFTIDRFDWNIGVDGSWLEKKLVDSDIELEISLVLN